MSEFQLYHKEDRGVLPFEDYGAIMAFTQEHHCRRCLEFGPGYSTLAMAEGNALYIDTYEDHLAWAKRAEQLLRPFAGICIRLYDNLPVLDLAPLANADHGRYDLALVDGPVGRPDKMVTHHGQEGLPRYNTLKYALDHATHVLLHDVNRPGEQATVAALGCTIHHLTPRLGLIKRNEA